MLFYISSVKAEILLRLHFCVSTIAPATKLYTNPVRLIAVNKLERKKVFRGQIVYYSFGALFPLPVL
jgi:hypothetical protein